MILISWNVNGFRSCLNKGFIDVFNKLDADIFSIQETKMLPGQAEFSPEGYYQYWNSAERKGYSGTAVFAKKMPVSFRYGIGNTEFDSEGRVITLEYESFYLVNTYTPNSKRELERLSYRMKWEDAVRNYLIELDSIKPVIYCGDLNVAHNEIDLKNPKTNRMSAGFSDDERNKFGLLLSSGFTDSFRYIYPNKICYSWWSYMFHARDNNAGWRIDYFIVSNRLVSKIKDAYIFNDIMGSDHCPVGLDIDI